MGTLFPGIFAVMKRELRKVKQGDEKERKKERRR
jgi:hypothetical protein